MSQSAPAPAAPQQQAKPLAPATVAAIREQVLLALTEDAEVRQSFVAALQGTGAPIEIGAKEAEQILDLLRPLIKKVAEEVVRSLIRPDYLLRPHLRPDQVT